MFTEVLHVIQIFLSRGWGVLVAMEIHLQLTMMEMLKIIKGVSVVMDQSRH